MKNRLPCALAALLLACPSQAAETPAAAMAPSGLDERLLLPDVALTDRHGGTQGLVSRYEDAGLVLYGFIYTNCTESCGLTISVMGLVDMDLQMAGAPDLRLVSVSVDPWRDTPAVLDEVAEMVQASPGWDWVVASFEPRVPTRSGVPAPSGLIRPPRGRSARRRPRCTRRSRA